MAITTLDQLIAASKQNESFFKLSATSKSAGSFHSLWTVAGKSGAGSAAGSAAGAVCTNTTAGGMSITSPGGSNTLYLASVELAGATAGTFIIYDRLVHTSGLVGNVATAQTVNSVALTRNTTGEEVECWLEWYTATGATATTATVSYTNEQGTSGRTGVATTVASMIVGQVLPVTLQAGDKGVRSVQSVTLAASTGTAGNFGVTLVRRVVHIPISLANVGQLYDWGSTGLPPLESNPCLAIALLCSTTSTGVVTGLCKFVEG